jgi:hypothetical protein
MKPVVGIVVSNKMQKSVVVAVDRLFQARLNFRHPHISLSSFTDNGTKQGLRVFTPGC